MKRVQTFHIHIHMFPQGNLNLRDTSRIDNGKPVVLHRDNRDNRSEARVLSNPVTHMITKPSL